MLRAAAQLLYSPLVPRGSQAPGQRRQHRAVGAVGIRPALAVAHGTTSMVVTVLDFDVKVGLCDFIYRDLYVYIYIYNMCVCLKKAWSCHVCACTSHSVYNSCVYCSWKRNSEWLIFDWSNSLAPRQGPREAIAQRPHAINVLPRRVLKHSYTIRRRKKNVAMIISVLSLLYPIKKKIKCKCINYTCNYI